MELMKRAILIVPALFFAWYLFHFAGLGLRADFTHDDLMNMNWALQGSYADHWKDIVLFWRPTPSYRPLGAVVYKVSLDLAGLNLFPLRVFCYVLLGLNVFLLYAVTRRLDGSREIAALAALLHAYHRNFSALYFNNGTIYDILCFTLTFAAILYYIRAREAGRPLGLTNLAVFCLLCLLALNSKEMALAIPLLVGAYELIYHPPPAFSWKGSLPGPAAAAAVAAIYYFGRVSGPAGVASVGMYRPHIGLAEYLTQTGNYLDYAFCLTGWFTATRTAVFLLALVGVTGLLRSRLLGFGAALFALGILPIAFIPARGLNAAYIPTAGLAMYIGGLLVTGRDLLPRPARPGKILLFAMVACLLMRIPSHTKDAYNSWLKEYGQIRSFMSQLETLHPTLPHGARILVVKDPFGKSRWAPQFIASLVYRNPALFVVRLESVEKKPTAAEVAAFYARLSYEDGRLRDLSPAEVLLNP